MRLDSYMSVDQHKRAYLNSDPITHFWYHSGDCSACGTCFSVNRGVFKTGNPFVPTEGFKTHYDWTCNNCGARYKRKP